MARPLMKMLKHAIMPQGKTTETVRKDFHNSTRVEARGMASPVSVGLLIPVNVEQD